MQFTEDWKNLPEGLEIPYMRTKSSLEEEKAFRGPSDYSDRGCYTSRLTSSGYIMLMGNDASQAIEKPEHLFRLVERHRHTILTIPLNEVSILWKGFSDSFKEGITKDPNLWTSEGAWVVSRPSPRKYLFRNRKKWYTIWILDINTKGLGWNPSRLAEEYLKLGEIGLTPNLSGIPATGRDFLFGPGGPGEYSTIREEFHYIKHLEPKLIERMYSACKRPAMVCRELGVTPPAYNEDMRKAFLQGLRYAPTMSPFLTTPDKTPTFNPDANHGVYLIEITIPQDWVFSPNLFRSGDSTGDYGVICPTGGPQIQLAGQLRMKLYDNLKIPFRIFEAWKLLPTNGGPVYPWVTRSLFLEYIVEIVKKDFPDIEANLLYQAAIGSLLTSYEYHDKIGDTKASTLSTFNPLLELFIYEWVFINNWLRMIENPSYTQLALRIDACSTLDHKGFSPDTSGLYRLDPPLPTRMFFANPRQKDKDIEGSYSKYYKAVKRAARRRDNEVLIEAPVVGNLEMLLEGLIESKDYGRYVNLVSRLNLDGETRVPSIKKYREGILPKDLIDSQIDLVDPHLE